MKCVQIVVMLVLISALVLFCSCELPEDDDESDEDDERPYQDTPAMVSDPFVALLDPYDGSLELFDPITEKRNSVRTTKDVSYAVLLDDLEAAALLDTELDEVSIVDLVTKQILATAQVGEAVNRLVISPFGPHLLAIYDPSVGEADYGEGGIINYFELNILDLDEVGSGTLGSRTVSIDFTPSNIVFNPNGGSCLLGKDYRLIELNLDSVETVTYPLSLEPEYYHIPRNITLSPDGEFAIVLMEGSVDVYVLDLVVKSINILDLSYQADDVVFIPDTRVALLPISASQSVAVVDLDEAIPEELDLGNMAQHVSISPDATKALLYASQGNIVTVMDLIDFRRRQYPLSIGINSQMDQPVAFTPDSSRVVVFGDYQHGSYGANDINVIDLDNRVVVPIGLEDRPVDYAFSTNLTTIGIILPLINKFVVLDLVDLQAQSVEIGDIALRTSYLHGAGVFVLDYDDRRGRISFAGDFGSDVYWDAKRFFDRP